MTFFSSLSARLKPHGTFFFIVALILISTFGFFWYRSGFTLEFNKFFASSCDPNNPDDIANPNCYYASCQGVSVCESKFGDGPGDGCVVGEACGEPTPSVCDPNTEPGSLLHCSANGNVKNGCGDTVQNCNGLGCTQGPGAGEASCNLPPPPTRTPGGTGNGACVSAAGIQSWPYTAPDGATPIIHTYSDIRSGCGNTQASTTDEADLVPLGGNNYSIRWNPNTIPSDRQCGHYQIDVRTPPNENGRWGIILDWGVACGTGGPSPSVSSTPTPTATITPIPAPLSCTARSASVSTNQQVDILATGGTGTYTWSAPSGTPATGAGNPFGVSYSIPGMKTVTVASGNNQATCPVIVIVPTPSPTATLTPTPTPAGTCQPRPACLDATPPCYIRVPIEGWCATPTPSPSRTPSPSPTPTATLTPSPTATVTTTATITTTVTPTPSVQLTCSPSNITVNPNTVTTFSAAGGQGTYSWNAPNGSPSTGTGSSIGVLYVNPGSNQITVTSGTQTASCNVIVNQPPTGLSCNPSSQSAFMNQTVNVSASGGSGAYGWSAPGGIPGTGSGSSFSTQYLSLGTQTITLSSGSETRTCTVVISAAITPTPTATTIFTTPALSTAKTVRNITQNGSETEVASANPNDTVEFTIRVSSVGNSTAFSVRVVDTLPVGITYVAGSTTIDGTTANDGITSGGLTIGDMTPGRTIVVRFRGIVASEGSFSIGTSTLTNLVTASASNVAGVSDTAFVNVTRGTGTIALSISKHGRNVTRGGIVEQSSVNTSPSDSVEFIIRVRSLSAATTTNVIVKDVIPTYVTYQPGTTSLNGIVTSDGLATAQGINIGSLAPGQEAVIRFSGRVNAASSLPAGTTTVINTAQTSADNVPAIIAQLPIIISKGSVSGISTVPTGASESVVLALGMSVLITLMYVTYTKTEMFKRREVESMVEEDRKDDSTFNFKK